MSTQNPGQEFVRLALAVDEHLPGYVDSYFGPAEWQVESKQTGKLPLPDLTERADQLANDISQADDLDSQRKDFLQRQVTAMQMTLRLLAGEIVAYLQKYERCTEREAQQSIKFISNPLYRSYTFTYHIGYNLLEKLFAKGNREAYLKRLLEEPVTPSQVREWISSGIKH